MKITKYGHCCLLIEEKGMRILTDPGAFSSGQDELSSVDLVLITHEHQDHFHMDSVKNILKNNPQAKIITNTAVGKLLTQENIPFEVLEHGGSKRFNDLLLEGFGETHAVIYEQNGLVQNTGYFIDNRLFYPGDQFTNPGKPVDILALPVAAPWLKISETIDYAKQLKPRISFPVHDAIVSNFGLFIYVMLEAILPQFGVTFQKTENQKAFEV